jgi:putative ABC transport system permease protein
MQMSAFLQDVAYTLRQIRRNPAFSIFVIATLALGIGSNVTIFSAVHALLLRPLPYDASEQLVALSGRYDGRGDRWSVSLPNAVDWGMRSTALDDLAYYQGASYSIAGDGTPERLPGVRASANLFAVLGRGPQLGRTFSAAEDSPDGDRVVVLSHGLWQRRYGGTQDILGQELNLSGTPHTVIGVMPPRFGFPSPGVELWLPVRGSVTTWPRSQGGLQTVARLRAGISMDQARADTDAVSAALAQEHTSANGDLSIAIRPLRQALYGMDNLSAIVIMLLSSVAFVLLIACVNVANLMLTRATARQREVGVRAAMGAPRSRLLRQFVTESIVLAAMGGAAGLLLAVWGVELLPSLFPADAPIPRDFGIDLTVLGFAAVVTLLTGVLFGVWPALHASRVDLTAMFGTRSSATGAIQGRRRDSLVVAEVALAAVLLVSAGLMLRSVITLLSRDPGFNESSALTLRVSLDATFNDPGRTDLYQQQVLEQLRALPGVASAGAVDFLPLGGTSNFNDYYLSGVEGNRNAGNVAASPGYIEAMGIPLLRGRGFEERDDRTALGVAVVTSALADQAWPGTDPIGQRLSMGYEIGGDAPVVRTVVGVIGGVRHGGLDNEPRPEIYIPIAQLPWATRTMTLVLRTAGDPLALVEPARRAIWSVDANQPIYDVRTLEQVVRDSSAVFLARLLAGALGVFAAIALLLAALGLYGVISYNVARRTYELGVRAALGAQRGDLLRLVFRHGAALVAAGLAIGFVAALAAGRLISGMLFGVKPTDPLTYAVVTVALVAVAALALLVPALRAARVSPVQALRSD